MKMALLTAVATAALSTTAYAAQTIKNRSTKSNTAMAQNSNSGSYPNSNTMSYSVPSAAEGFRVSLLRPMLKAELKGSGDVKIYDKNDNEVGKTSDEVKNTMGFGLGYANVPVQSVGFAGQLAYLKLEGEKGSDDVNLLRLEGNATYGFTDSVYAKGGLNFSKFTSKNFEKLDGGFGLQAGVGFQVTQNLGFDLNYGLMNFSKDFNESGYSGKLELQLRGFEVGLTGTF